ncbi:type II secretion system protein GspD [Sulfuriroseicoccus oceanibius]|uniref:Uncharacterized protein n=1 Tax=Sulfuriroseicoccus oceanibius TaxID=2707525 RepID=A0A6B3L7H4_9BACT|nr:secretin N-terminal domain-containing protein [Sulfuriroseicoccus oceanibius]QQL44484.1 hypothetical protein G3M56_011420 [Sulfuriroseicoccus oceanibius]
MKTKPSIPTLAMIAATAIGSISSIHAQGEPPADAPVSALERERVAAEAAFDGLIFEGEPLNDVIGLLATQAGKSYTHNPALNGPQYSVAGNIAAGDPLATIQELAFGFNVEIHVRGNTIYALSPQDVQQLPQEEWAYQLKYLRPSDFENLRGIIQPLLTPGTGTVNFEPKTNTLLVIDSKRRIERINNFMAKLDRPKGQIIVETKILRINSSAGSRIGVDWSSTLGEQGLTFDAIQNLNSLFNLPDSRSLSKVTTDDFTSGQELANSVTNGLIGGANGQLTNNGSLNTNSIETRSSTPGSGLVLAPVQLQAVLRALNEGNIANQRTNPTLITEDNEQALITIIDRVPIITSTISQTSAGQNITDEVRYTIDESDPTLSDAENPGETREVGVTLTVTPTLLPDNTIRMDLRPRTAQIVDFVEGRSGNVYPRVTESMVQSIARVPNGHSLIIGGFYGYTDSNKENKVPILGDIPVVNFFFKSKETIKESTSLVFIITPTSYDPSSAIENLRANDAIYDNVALDSDHNEVFSPRVEGVAHRSNMGNTVRNIMRPRDDKAEDQRNPLVRPERADEKVQQNMERYEATYQKAKAAQSQQAAPATKAPAKTTPSSKKFEGGMFD